MTSDTGENNAVSGQTARPRLSPLSRRVLLLVIALLALAVLGFHTITDSGRLADSHILGASDYVGAAVCHRITERSFTIAGRQLPLCARCTGTFLGVTLVFVLLSLAGRSRWSRLPPTKIVVALMGFIVLFAIDGTNSYLHFFEGAPHLYEPQNWLRLVTGMGAGLALGTIIYPALAQTLWRDQIFEPSIGSFAELAGLVLVAAIVVVLVLIEQPLLLFILGLASAAGVLLILTSIGIMLILIIAKRDAQAENMRQVLLPLLGGLLFASAQIAIIGYARIAITGTINGLPGL